MLQRTRPYLKKKFTLHPRSGRSGAKNLAWRPKIPLASLQQFDFSFNLESPGRIPQAWNAKECARLGLQAWPKEVGFYNAGDNFELTPEMHLRLFRKNHNSEFWTQDHNEKTIISLMPLVEEKPKEAMPLVTEVFQAHLSRFGADHIIYNAVMQARAFTKDVDGTMALFKEMQTLGLEPNAQSYINVILAMQLAGKPKAAALDFFTQAVTSGAMPAVVRIDTEFEMWWCQLERMGSFTSQRGYLSNKEEGAVPLPRDPFAIWGWSRDERKFVPEDVAVRAEVSRRTRSDGMAGTVFSNVRRAPWFKYRGFKRYDFKGPRSTPNAEDVNLTAPAPRQNPYLPRATSE